MNKATISRRLITTRSICSFVCCATLCPPRMTSTLGLTPGLSILVLGTNQVGIEVIPKKWRDIWTTSSTNLKTAGFQR
jgi:hypothetical protein